MEESFSNGKKTLLEKEKLLVMSNFSYSHSVFKRLVLQTRKNQGLFGKGLTLYHTIMTLQKKAFENIVGKGEKACNQHFLLSHNVIYSFHKKTSLFESL